jgi:hypothetical protein
VFWGVTRYRKIQVSWGVTLNHDIQSFWESRCTLIFKCSGM